MASIKNRLHLFVVLMLMPVLANASTSAAGITGVMNHFKTITQGWFTSFYVDALGIFAVLFGAEIVWMVVKWLITGKDVHEMLASFLKKMITIAFFYSLLFYSSTWVPDLINGFTNAASLAGGAPSTSVGDMFDTGINTFVTCFNAGPMAAAHDTSSAWSDALSGNLSGAASAVGKAASAELGTMTGLDYLIGAIVGLIMILAFAYAALELLAVQLESMIVLSVGVLMLGFGGSSLTSSYVESYLKYALTVGVRLLMITLWVSFIEWKVNPLIKTTLINGNASLESFGIVLILGMLIAFLTKKLPGFANSILSGSSTMSGGELMSSAVKTAALGTAVVATGGAAAAIGGAAGATEAGGMAAAAGEAGGAAASGAGSMGAAAGEAGGTAGSSAGSMGGGSGINPPAETPTPNMAASKSSTPASSSVNAPKLEDVSSRIKPSGQSSNNNAKGGNTETVGQGSPTLNQSGSTDDATGSNDSSTSDSGIVDAAEGAATALGVESVASTLNGAKTAASGVAAPKVVPSNAGKAASNMGGTSKASTDNNRSAAPASDGVDKTASAPAADGVDKTASAPAADGVDKTASAPAADGVDHRAVAPNDTQTSGGSNKGVEAPTDDGSGGSTPPKAPEKESFLETHARHEKNINKVIDTLMPGESSSANVSAPSLGLKHLSD